MSTIADYIGRTVDVVMFQGSKPYGAAQLEQALSLAGEGGRAATGVIKLGQWFLLSLLTEKGSCKHFPSRGSTFLLELRLGYIRTAPDLLAAFSRALLDVTRDLRASEQLDGPYDEKFEKAEILGVTLADGYAVASVRVTSQEPDVSVVMPLQVKLR